MHPNNIWVSRSWVSDRENRRWEFFLFGSMLNRENEEKRKLEFCFALFFSHVGRLAGVLCGKGRTFLTLKNTSAKSA